MLCSVSNAVYVSSLKILHANQRYFLSLEFRWIHHSSIQFVPHFNEYIVALFLVKFAHVSKFRFERCSASKLSKFGKINVLLRSFLFNQLFQICFSSCAESKVTNVGYSDTVNYLNKTNKRYRHLKIILACRTTFDLIRWEVRSSVFSLTRLPRSLTMSLLKEIHRSLLCKCHTDIVISSESQRKIG